MKDLLFIASLVFVYFFISKKAEGASVLVEQREVRTEIGYAGGGIRLSTRFTFAVTPFDTDVTVMDVLAQPGVSIQIVGSQPLERQTTFTLWTLADMTSQGYLVRDGDTELFRAEVDLFILMDGYANVRTSLDSLRISIGGAYEDYSFDDFNGEWLIVAGELPPTLDIPEPAALSLAGLGIAAVLRRKRS